MTLRQGFTRLFLFCIVVTMAAAFDSPLARPNDEPEFAPIVEHKLDFYDFTLPLTDGRAFNLREYTTQKRLIIVCYVAGWCPNSNRNGHIVKRLYDKYHERGLGVVAVSEYTTAPELRIHINRIGMEYPVVVDTSRQQDRKDSLHYKLRRQVADKRKWGTPFYVLLDTKDIEAATPKAPLARRVFTVAGEIIESEAESFIEKRLASQ